MSSEAAHQRTPSTEPAPPSAPAPAPRDREPWERSSYPTIIFVISFVVLSVVGHAVAFGGLSAYAAIQRDLRPLNKPVELVMFEVEPPRPPPPPPKIEEPPPPPPKPKKVKPPPIKVAEPVKPPPEPPPEAAPPPPNEEAPKEPPKPVPLVVGITMSSTTASGGFAAPVGNTSYGKIEGAATDPSKVQQYRAPKYVPSYQVDRQPELVNEVKVPYPREAQRAGIEGDVVLSIRIDDKGNVVEVKVLDGPGYGLNEAAAAALRRFKWRPATQGGEPVTTQITYTYKFYLE